MREIVLFLLLLTLSAPISGQISFKVTDVEIAKDTISEVSFQDALEARIGAKIESFDYSKKNLKIVPAYYHSFVEALHHSYADHRPLVISPDMIWLMICQGLAQHVEQQSDSLQSQLVNFQGKKTIIIKNNDLVKGKANNNWAGEFPKFTDSIKKYVDPQLYNFFIPEFSTTTKTEKLAYQITLMKAVDSYFEYIETTECGIPQIILEGTTKDWKSIYKNARKLDDYGMQFWTKELLPILKEFINASKGKVNKKFWQSIYKWNSSCGQDGVTGWILKLFPYYYTGGGYVYMNSFRNRKVNPKKLPTGIAKVNLNWIYGLQPNQELYGMEIYAGFLGIQQNKTTKAIKPLIQWSIRDKASEEVNKYGAAFYTKRVFDRSDFSEEIEGEEIIVDIDIPEEEEEYELDENIYLIVEKMPEFPGGEQGLRRYIDMNIKYPKNAVEDSIEGEIYVRFCVRKNGKVDRVSIAKGVNSILGNEALRVISSLPKWKPGTIGGKKVNAWYIVPVYFSLKPD